MKVTKAFFTKDNRLNKGYTKTSSTREPDNSFYRKKFEHMLPPIEVISQYEDIHPGTLAKLIDMADQEQQHRHALNLVNVENYNQAIKTGRLFALAFIGLICATTIGLSWLGKILGAIIFSSSAFLAIGAASIIFARKTATRREHKEPYQINRKPPPQ